MISLLTEKLVELSQGMLHVNSEVRDEGKGYLMFDDGGVEIEVAEYLWGFTRLIKPERVLTSGIYTGISDMYIAQGLKDNGYGKSTALEFEPQHLNRATELFKKTQVIDYIEPVLISSLAYQPSGAYQLMFLDTEPNLRFAELVKFYPYLEPGGFVFIHDAPRNLAQGNINPDHPEIESWPFGNLPNEIKNWVKDRELEPMHFPNPRGLLGLYRARSDDYKWL